MGKINWSRVILGGLLWAIVYNVLAAAAMFLYLGRELGAAVEALGRPFHLATGMIVFMLTLSLVGGIYILWFYAAIRPRYGPGPKTALIAAFASWLIAGAAMSALNALGLVSTRFLAIDLGTALVAFIAATLVGTWQYQE